MNATIVKTLRYLPIPETIAEEARRTRRDRFGHELHVTRTQGPCRVCLRIPRVPEDLMLLSYQPLADTGPYAEIGPIFIHANHCEPYADAHVFPGDFRPRRLILRAYGHEGEIVTAVIAEPGTAPERAAELLDDDRVTELHARHESYTCFDFKILREATAP